MKTNYLSIKRDGPNYIFEEFSSGRKKKFSIPAMEVPDIKVANGTVSIMKFSDHEYSQLLNKSLSI